MVKVISSENYFIVLALNCHKTFLEKMKYWLQNVWIFNFVFNSCMKYVKISLIHNFFFNKKEIVMKMINCPLA